MPDLLLIFPSLTQKEKYGLKNFKFKQHENLPPLGLAGIAAYIREKKFSVEIIEPVSMEMDLNDIFDYIKENDPKVIGFSVLTPIFHKAVEIGKAIRRKFPSKIIIIGGHHATMMPEKIMRENEIFDILAYGEGENTLHELMMLFNKYKYERTVLNDYDSLEIIDGIVFRKGKKIAKTKPRKLIDNLDELPMPARDLLPIKKYVPPPLQYKKLPVIHLMVSRGCPFHCTYCSTHAVFGYKPRFRSPGKVIEEIKLVKEKYGAKEITFWDDNLTLNKRWIIELCDLMINENLNVGWTCFGRINSVDREILEKMKEAGCWEIFYGIESGNQDLLDIIKKGITIEQTENIIKLTKAVGIEIRGLFMLGLPGETPEKAEKTIKFAIDLDLDYAQFTITTPHIGTELAEQAKKYGRLSLDLERYTQMEPVFLPYGYKDRQELIKIQRKAMRKFYFRLKYIVKMLRKIESMEDIKRYMEGLKLAFAFSK